MDQYSLFGRRQFIGPEESGQAFDLTDSGIDDFLARDLLDGAQRHIGFLGNAGPLPFVRCKLPEDIGVERFCHAQENKPYLGFSQPRLGTPHAADWCVMEKKTRQTKSKKRPTVVRGVLAQNVCALRDRKWSNLQSDTQRNKELARAARVSLNLVQQITKALSGTSIDNVEFMAEVFECRPANLLTPYFAVKDQPPKSDAPPRNDGAELRQRPGRAAPGR
jgi:hypothetical protein